MVNDFKQLAGLVALSAARGLLAGLPRLRLLAGRGVRFLTRRGHLELFEVQLAVAESG